MTQRRWWLTGNRCEDTDTAPSYVIYLLVMGYQLSVNDFLLNIPYGACRVNTGGSMAVADRHMLLYGI